MARWLIWLAAGAILVAAGIVLIVVGLDAADKLGGIIGAFTGLVGLALSAYALLGHRPSKPDISQSVKESTHPEPH